ncbi:nucleotide-binding domain-containing protein [Staphylococcus aureus]
MNLLFKLEIYNQCLEFKNIKWRVVNYGEEAKKDKELEFEMNQYEGISIVIKRQLIQDYILWNVICTTSMIK